MGFDGGGRAGCSSSATSTFFGSLFFCAFASAFGSGLGAGLGSDFGFDSVGTNVTDGGRAFFESPDALVSSDTNGKFDVYEWENGRVTLLSTGRGDADSYFADASQSGDDAFFVTRDRLVGQDQDNNYDLYDVRVNGGLAGQSLPVPPPPCGEDCQGVPSDQPSGPLAASVAFSGPGNATTSSLATATVLTHVVRGSHFSVKVKVPGKGQLTISGSGIRTVRRSVASAGSYRLRVALTPGARGELLHKHKLKLRLRVGYVPANGTASAARVMLTVKRGVPNRARRASRDRGGSR